MTPSTHHQGVSDGVPLLHDVARLPSNVEVGMLCGRSGRRSFFTVGLHLVLLMCMILVPVHSDGGVQVTVKVLSVMYNANWPTEYINSVNAGFNASLAARKWAVAPGIDVEVIRPLSYTTPAHQYLKEYMKGLDDNNSLVVVFGPMGDEDVQACYDTLEEYGIVGFAPLAGAAGFEEYLPHLYFLRPGLTSELIALIRYVVSYLRVRRLGFMYLEGVMGGSATYELAVDFVSRMGHKHCCVFALNDKGGELGTLPKGFDEAWKEFAKGRPQAVVVLATMKDVTKEFIRRLVADSRTADAFLLAPSLLQKSIVLVWKEALEAANAPFVPRRVKLTGTNPLAADGFFAAIRRFHVEMKDYITRYGNWSGFDDNEHFLKNDADGELMVTGWIAGEVLSRALGSHGWMNDRAAFFESLYEQRRYVIDDVVIGDFGGECADRAAVNGAMCHCNRGGRKVFMKEIADDYRLRAVLGGYIIQSALDCNGDPTILQPPLSGVSTIMEDRPHLQRATAQFIAGASSVASTGAVGDVNRFFLDTLATDVQSAADDIVQLQQDKIVTAAFGVATEEMLGLPNLVLIDPITPTPHLNSFSSNVVHLSPTLEQQLYVHATYLSNIGVGYAHCIIRANQAPKIKNLVKKTLVTFGLNLSTTNVLQLEDSIGEFLPAKGDLFLIGLVAYDIAPIEEHLRTHPKVRVFVQFSDVVLLHNEFVLAFNNSVGAKGLVFATNLPHWADVNSSSDTVRRFHDVVPAAEKWTPLSLLGFATGRAMQRNLQRMDEVTSDSLVELFFKETFITIDDMHYGPYRGYDCVDGNEAVTEVCTSNFGAADISVWSMSRVLRPEQPVLQDAMSPSMVYAVPNDDTLTPTRLAVMISSTVLLLSLLVGLSLVLYCVIRGNRDNDSAPKEPTEPVTLVFTDIESSTAQWATYPELMPDAVATHHRIIRTLISHYGCYEVKTVGDSFMIASKSPFAAVLLAQELQRRFLHNDWGTSTIDEFYRHSEEQCAEDCEEKYTPPTARLDPEVYGRLWNGLRVRVGIHTGLCDIRYDEVTKGYDYYGQTANMAARTESVANGGQVMLTHATYMSLGTAERDNVEVVSFGMVPLRGVSEPVEMWQLDAVPGRSFAELRLDRVADVPDKGDGTTSTSDQSSTHVELSDSAQAIAVSLQSLMGAFTPAQRREALFPFCERWRVVVPKRGGNVWGDDLCAEVVRRIAVKVGHVVDYHAVSVSEHSSTLSSESVLIISQRALGHLEL